MTEQAEQQAGRPHVATSRRAPGAQDAEVGVIGLGVMGACTLWQLARRGITAVGVEQHEPPHAFGSSHGETRIIRFAMYEGAPYADLVRQALPLWRELELDSGAALLQQCGVLLIDSSPCPDSIVRAAADTMRSLDLPFETLTGRDVERRYPQHVIQGDEQALHDPKGGFLKAEESVEAALKNAAERGATVLSSSAVTRLVVDQHGVDVETAEESFRVRHVVVTAGAWLTEFLPELTEHIGLERQIFGWFRLDEPSQYAPRACPVFIRHDALYGFPSQDGESIKIGFQTEGAPTELATLDRTVTDEQLTELHERLLAKHLHGVAGPVPGTGTACLYTMTPDGDFVVDRISDQISILGGFSGHGFKHAPALGAMAADLATKHDPAVPPQFLLSRLIQRRTRFNIGASEKHHKRGIICNREGIW